MEGEDEDENSQANQEVGTKKKEDVVHIIPPDNIKNIISQYNVEMNKNDVISCFL